MPGPPAALRKRCSTNSDQLNSSVIECSEGSASGGSRSRRQVFSSSTRSGHRRRTVATGEACSAVRRPVVRSVIQRPGFFAAASLGEGRKQRRRRSSRKNRTGATPAARPPRPAERLRRAFKTTGPAPVSAPGQSARGGGRPGLGLTKSPMSKPVPLRLLPTARAGSHPRAVPGRRPPKTFADEGGAEGSAAPNSGLHRQVSRSLLPAVTRRRPPRASAVGAGKRRLTYAR